MLCPTRAFLVPRTTVRLCPTYGTRLIDVCEQCRRGAFNNELLLFLRWRRTKGPVHPAAVLNTAIFSRFRKTCGSCKCTRDSHDVLHEEWVNVRDRLGFKPVQDPDKRVSKERSYSQGYSWVPPGLPSHKVRASRGFFFSIISLYG